MKKKNETNNMIEPTKVNLIQSINLKYKHDKTNWRTSLSFG